MPTAPTLAEHMDTLEAIARDEYATSGSLLPKVIISSDRLEVCAVPKPDEHPGDQAARLIEWLGMVLDPRHVVLITEAWYKQMAEDERKADGYARGDLERLHEAGDASVHTAVLLVGSDGTTTRTIYAPVDGEAERNVVDGEDGGYLVEVLPAALRAGREHYAKVRIGGAPMAEFDAETVGNAVVAALGQSGQVSMAWVAVYSE